jgi:AcrR family transcriptional regulator
VKERFVDVLAGGGSQPGTEIPLRADARRNRDQIIAAARTIFTEQGPDVPMEEIARAAGVGVGTLYRRFPDRDALIGAVARDNFHRVLTEARAAIAEEPTAWEALVRFLRQSRELQLSVQLAMISPMAAKVIGDDPLTDEFRQALLGELDAVVHAAQAEGFLRKDVDTGDVAMLFMLLLRQISSHYNEAVRIAPERCMALMLDGLRAQPGSTLPGRPLTSSDVNHKYRSPDNLGSDAEGVPDGFGL